MSRVVAIVGSYRRGGMTDAAVDAVLEGASGGGAEVRKVFLIDQHMALCDNCRCCAQTGGRERGMCIHQDGLDALLDEIDSSDAVVLAAPVNFFNVTAVFRQWMERLLVYTYWPWNSNLGPVLRRKERPRKAVLITSASMPSALIPLATGAPRALRVAARVLGARPVGHLWIGFVPAERRPMLRAATRSRAQRLGARLV